MTIEIENNNSQPAFILHNQPLLPHEYKNQLKEKYKLSGKNVLATFGSLCPGSGIETTLYALPAIVKIFPETVVLIIAETLPSVIKKDSYQYRNILDTIVRDLQLQNHVQYINYYLPIEELLDYLRLADVCVFTSKDADNTVNNICNFALENGCKLISANTYNTAGAAKSNVRKMIDFENAEQLSDAVINLLT